MLWMMIRRKKASEDQYFFFRKIDGKCFGVSIAENEGLGKIIEAVLK